MCHMMADTTEELMAMAKAIWLKPEWIQHPGKPSEHFDVAKSRRTMAISLGAESVSDRWMVLNLIQPRRDLAKALEEHDSEVR